LSRGFFNLKKKGGGCLRAGKI